MRESRFQVGIITSTHGVAGEVKVYPTTDDKRRFKKLKEVILDTGKEDLTLKIVSVKFFKEMVILKFEGYDNPEEMRKFRQKSLYVTRENAVRLNKDEYFIADLIGLRAVEENTDFEGEVTDVIQTGANDVYVIEYGSDEKKELLLPAIKECIEEVNVDDGYIKIHILDGLLD
ncbi:MAG: 16S rRNA processing protein RimM [Lachnospiraceae bacterium]|nr:16S rRNA processing protein RimM [Lachnospiraceae bacterium]